jgi:Skp family chaperone for outer membrane proteins
MNMMLLLTTLALALPGQAGGGVTVAVVDVPAVSEQFLGTKDLESVFEQRRVKFNQDRDALRERTEKLRRSLQEELKPGTAEFEERRKQLMMLEAELQWFTESQGQQIEAGLASSLHRIYNDIHTAVAEVAEANNIHIVLAADRLPPESPPTTQQARQQILLQKVIYWTPSVDITEAVVKHLNGKYKDAQAATEGGGGAAKPPYAVPDEGR